MGAAPMSESLLFLRRPNDALIFFGNRSQTFIYKPLHTLAAIRFRCVDVALGVGRDAVHSVKHSGLAAAFAESGQHLQRLTIDDVHTIVFSIRKINVFLLRISGECDVPDRTGAERPLVEEFFLQKLSFGSEYLNPIISAVANV